MEVLFMKRLYKSTTDKKLFGVCGGVAKYLGFDPTLVRLGTVLISCFWGTGLIIYLVAAMVMPTEPENPIE